MGKRLTKIYTRSGDKGTTSIGDGSRLHKSHLRLELIGDIDELNSLVGLVVSENNHDDELNVSLSRIQNELFDLGGEISIPGKNLITGKLVTKLEQDIDKINSGLEELEEFVLPGGTKAAATCHIARSVCRRCERHGWQLDEEEKNLNPASLQYINRLSDFLFVTARMLNKAEGAAEILWDRNRES